MADTRPSFALLLCCASTLALSACTGPLNTAHSVGRPGDRTSFQPRSIAESSIINVPDDLQPTADPGVAPVYTADGPVHRENAQPSVRSLDRSAWAPLDVTVPNDAPAHRPRYTNNVFVSDGTLRDQGRFPTAQSALDTTTARGNELMIREAALGPFAAAADIALFPIRFGASARPDRPTRTGSTYYQRAPEQRVIIPAPLEVVGTPSSAESTNPNPPAPSQPAASTPPTPTTPGVQGSTDPRTGAPVATPGARK